MARQIPSPSLFKSPTRVQVSSPRHHDLLVSGLWNLFRAGQSIDFVIQWGEKSIGAHQLLLDVFLSPQKQTRDQNQPEDNTNHDEIRSTMDLLLEFLYNGTVSVPRLQLKNLREVAAEMEFGLLVDAVDAALASGEMDNLFGADMCSSRPVIRSGSLGRGSSVGQVDNVRPTVPITSTMESVHKRTDSNKHDCYDPVDESVDNSKDYSIDDPIDDPLDDLLDDPLDDPINDPVEDSLDVPLDDPLDNLDTQSMKDSTHSAGHPETVDDTLNSDDSSLSADEPETNFVDPDYRPYSTHVHNPPKRISRTNHLHESLNGTAPSSNNQITANSNHVHCQSDSIVNPEMPCDELTNREQLPGITAISPANPVCENHSEPPVGRRMTRGWRNLASTTTEHPDGRSNTQSGPKPTDKPPKTVPNARPHLYKRPFQCPTCQKIFKRSQHLKEHIRSHTREKPYKCTEPGCDKAYGQESALIMHRRTHTSYKPFRCPHCPRTFYQKCQLVAHVTTHSDERPFQCDQCEKRFRVKHSLREHYEIHSERAKRFKCDRCPEKFSHIHEFKLHKLTHTGEPPRICYICGKTFADRFGMNMHLRQHSLAAAGRLNEKVHMCAVCGQAFSSSSSLMFHGYIHTGVKPFKCVHCDKSFRRPSYLRSHLLMHERQKDAGAGQEEVCAQSAVPVDGVGSNE